MMLETTIQGTLHHLSPEADQALRRTARLFQAAQRTAFQRLTEGQGRKEIEPLVRERFGLDARYARDAILEAEATQAALRELLPDYLANTKAKIAKVEARLTEYRIGQRQPKRAPLVEILLGLERRLVKLQVKRDKWQAHLEAGTVPPVIFGSAATFHARRKGQLSHTHWRAQRRNQFWSRGEKNKAGNLHLRIQAQEDRFTLSIATLPMVKGRLTYYVADLWLPEEQRALLQAGLSDAYSVRLLRDQDGWQAHITVREMVPGEWLPRAPENRRVGGLDCNTDRLTVAVISPQGNLLAHHTVWMRGLGDMRAKQAEWVIGNALTDCLDWLEQQSVTALVVEQLKFRQTHDTHKRFNRATTKFRSTMVGLAMRQALRRGMDVVQINSAYTSVIGQHKYATAYGLSGHEAAALVIARRGQGRAERLPQKIVVQLPRLRERLLAEAMLRGPKDKVKATYLKWAAKLDDWKHQHSWSLWSIWEKASHLLLSDTIHQSLACADVSYGRMSPRSNR